jgi:hypothetical protein
MKKAVLIVTLLAGANLVWAGASNHFETRVDLTRRVAYGSFTDTRASADTTQYIGCDLYLSGGTEARLGCLAKDTALEALSCSTTNPEIVKISQAISDQSYIYFRCDASGELDYLFVSNGSRWLD